MGSNVTVGQIIPEIYGPRIVEQLQRESMLLSKMEGPNKTTAPKKPKRLCTNDDLYIYSTDYEGIYLCCDNCHVDVDLGHSEDIKVLIPKIQDFKHHVVLEQETTTEG